MPVGVWTQIPSPGPGSTGRGSRRGPRGPVWASAQDRGGGNLPLREEGQNHRNVADARRESQSTPGAVGGPGAAQTSGAQRAKREEGQGTVHDGQGLGGGVARLVVLRLGRGGPPG